MRRVYEPRSVTGERLFDALVSGGGTRKELMLRAALTPSQFRDACEYIREVLCPGGGRPYAVDARTHRYSLADTVDEADAYEQFRLKGMLRQTELLYKGTIVPQRAAFGDSKAYRLAARQFERLIEDLTELVSA